MSLYTIVNSIVKTPKIPENPIADIPHFLTARKQWLNTTNSLNRALSLDKFCTLVNEFLDYPLLSKQSLYNTLSLLKDNVKSKLRNKSLSDSHRKIFWAISFFSDYTYPQLIEMLSGEASIEVDYRLPLLPESLTAIAVAAKNNTHLPYVHLVSKALDIEKPSNETDGLHNNDDDYRYSETSKIDLPLDIRLGDLLKGRKFLSKRLLEFCLEGNHEKLKDIPADDIVSILFDESPVPKPITYALLPDVLGITISEMIVGLRSRVNHH